MRDQLKTKPNQPNTNQHLRHFHFLLILESLTAPDIRHWFSAPCAIDRIVDSDLSGIKPFPHPGSTRAVRV
jgi:hypothetical protein